MTSHTIHLHREPFASIANGKKTIESRLYDEKRQRIQLGDELLFTNREDPSQTVTVSIVGLLRYRTFHDLTKFDGTSIAQLEDQINEFYTISEQQEYGVVGIEFKLNQ